MEKKIDLRFNSIDVYDVHAKIENKSSTENKSKTKYDMIITIYKQVLEKYQFYTKRCIVNLPFCAMTCKKSYP